MSNTAARREAASGEHLYDAPCGHTYWTEIHDDGDGWSVDRCPECHREAECAEGSR